MDGGPYGVIPLEGGGVVVHLQEELTSCAGRDLEAKQPVRVWRQAPWLCPLGRTVTWKTFFLLDFSVVQPITAPHSCTVSALLPFF